MREGERARCAYWVSGCDWWWLYVIGCLVLVKCGSVQSGSVCVCQQAQKKNLCGLLQNYSFLFGFLPSFQSI